MPQVVDIPDQGQAEFPDEMSQDDIKAAIQKKFYPQPAATSVPTQGSEIQYSIPGVGTLPVAIGKPLKAAEELAKEQIPKSVGQAAEMAGGLLTPIVPAVKTLIETPRKLGDVLFGGKTVAEAFPESQTFVEAEKTPPFSVERYKAGLGTLAQFGMAALLGKQITPSPLGETLGVVKPETPSPIAQEITPQVAATNEALARVQQQAAPEAAPQAGGEPNASQITSATSTVEPEVRPQVGEGTPLRQQGETPQARQGTETGPETPQEPVTAEQVATAGTAKPVETTIPAVGKEPLRNVTDIPEDAKTIGLTKDYISKDRAERGEPPLAQEARQSNPQTWDKSAEIYSGNPNAGHELVASIVENPRAINPDEVGVLLRHRVDLSNQADFEYNRLTSKSSTPSEKGEASVKLAALNEARNQADMATSSVASQLGRSFQFLQKLSDQDYSLSGLMKQRVAARGGVELTEEQMAEASDYSKDILEKDRAWQDYLRKPKAESALAAYKSRLKTLTTDYERRAAFSEFEPQIRRQLELDPEARRLKGDLQTSKLKWEKLLAKDQLSNRPKWQKILGGTAWAARESALSGYHTLAKLAGFTGGKLAEIPLTQTAERVWGLIPGFRDIAAKSEFGPGANARALGKLYSEFFTTGMKQAYQQLRTGTSDFKAQYGDDKIALNYPSFFGNLHGVEKTPLRVGSAAMSRERIIQKSMNDLSSKAVAEGHDITDPIIQAAINKLSFDAGTNDILMGNNLFADKVNGFFRSMEGKTKTGEPSIELNILSTLAKTFLTKGIVRTPANFVTQVFERTPLGLARGLARGGRAIYKGVDNVPPAERTAIMRLLGVGSVGSGMFLWGALDALRSPDNRMFGGYYQPGEKRDTNDVKFGSVRLGDYTAPHYLTHNLLSEPAQMGNTLMRVSISALNKKDRTNKGLVAGTIAATLGLAQQAPIANPAFRLEQLGDPRQQSSYFGDLVRGLIPQLVQNIAEDVDQSEGPRKAKGIIEKAKLGIPILREQVEEKKEKPKKGSGTVSGTTE